MNVPLKVGDDLNSRTLYFNVPSDIVIGNDVKYICKTTNSNSYIFEGEDDGVVGLFVHYVNSQSEEITESIFNTGTLIHESYSLPDDFGDITEVDETAVCYQYTKKAGHEKLYAVTEDGNKEEVKRSSELLREFLNIAHPVGSYYETSDTNFDPNVSWVGSWVEDTEGLVTVALKTSDNDFSYVGRRMGEKYHTLTLDEMPSHSHSFRGVNDSAATTPLLGEYPIRLYQDTAINWQGTSSITSSGGSQPHNNVQPGIVVKRWHRIS